MQVQGDFSTRYGDVCSPDLAGSRLTYLFPVLGLEISDALNTKSVVPVSSVLVPNLQPLSFIPVTGKGSSLEFSVPVERLRISDPQIKPPMRWFSFGRWFRFGIGLFLLLGVLLTSAGCSSSNAAQVPWKDAASIVGVPVVQSVLKVDTSLAPDAYSDVRAWVVDSRNAKLVVFDFNNVGLCGTSGCLYSGYLIKKNSPVTRVFSSYLNPSLPPGRPLFAIGDKSNSELPCIQVMQQVVGGIRQLDYCYNGTSYRLAQSDIVETNPAKDSKDSKSSPPLSLGNKSSGRSNQKAKLR